MEWEAYRQGIKELEAFYQVKFPDRTIEAWYEVLSHIKDGRWARILSVFKREIDRVTKTMSVATMLLKLNKSTPYSHVSHVGPEEIDPEDYGPMPEWLRPYWNVLRQTNNLFRAVQAYPDTARKLYGVNGEKAALTVRKDVQFVLETGELPEKSERGKKRLRLGTRHMKATIDPKKARQEIEKRHGAAQGAATHEDDVPF